MPSSGATFAVFSAPSITDAGEVIFGGWNDTTAPIWKGIYSREQNKPPTMLVDSSSLHPALHKPFTDIEGSLPFVAITFEIVFVAAPRGFPHPFGA